MLTKLKYLKYNLSRNLNERIPYYMNKVILMGRLTRDPEIRYSSGERSMAIARYTLAVDRRRFGRQADDGQPSADFITCIAFDKAAEFAEKYLHQGTKMLVTGRIQTGSYTNKDGQKVYTTEVMIEEQEFAESKSSQDGSSYRNTPTSSDGFMNIPDSVEDEGLPFS